ncbi:MAG: AMP-binding protein, partial [Polyangiales bacterium]
AALVRWSVQPPQLRPTALVAAAWTPTLDELVEPKTARIVVAAPVPATIAEIRDALATRTPIALLHAKLAPAELARQCELVEAAAFPEDTAAILFTSGSTGTARGVVLSRTAIDAACAASATNLGWRDGDRWLLALSTAHAGGLAVVARCTAAGVPIELLEQDADLAAALARCTLASLVPAQLVQLLADPGWRSPPGLRAVLLGGAAAPPALVAEATARGLPVLTTYGLTETFGQVATAPLDRAGDPGAPLVVLPGVALVAGTRETPARITVTGPTLATCYLDGTPIAPAFVTADLGFLEDGTLHVVGRMDDVIISGGENVHPLQIEDVLAATPGVRAACAFGVQDAQWGQIVGAALAVDEAFDLAAASAHWHAQLPPHARPRQIAVVTDLPLLPGGKIDRRAAAALPRGAVAYR